MWSEPREEFWNLIERHTRMVEKLQLLTDEATQEAMASMGREVLDAYCALLRAVSARAGDFEQFDDPLMSQAVDDARALADEYARRSA